MVLAKSKNAVGLGNALMVGLKSTHEHELQSANVYPPN